MRIPFFAVFLLFSTFIFGQEIGYIQNGNHSIKLTKNTYNYSISYSDINIEHHNTFLFPKVESVYNIIIDGFESVEDHLVIVKTTNDTIVKFEFKKRKGIPMVKIKQNNLLSASFGVSAFYSKADMVALFGNP